MGCLHSIFSEISRTVDADVVKFETHMRQERARQQLDASRREAEALAREREEVIEWCKRHGYASLDAPKVTLLARKMKFPLHTAVSHQTVRMVELLLKHGADRYVKDSWNCTAKDYAVRIRDRQTREAILSALDC